MRLIRDKEIGRNLSKNLYHNNTLHTAARLDMNFRFLDRLQYHCRNTDDFIQNLQNKYPKSYILPECGSNTLILKGFEEILNENASSYDHLCIPMGTGGTFCELLRRSGSH